MTENADSTTVVSHRVKLPSGDKVEVAVVLAGNNNDDCHPSNPASPAVTYAYVASSGRLLWKSPTMGRGRCTTAAPAVSRGFVYSAGLDGVIHRYRLTTGREDTNGGWPVRFTRMPYVEKESSNLVVHRGRLYVTTSGFIGDAGHYEGHVVTVNLKTGRATVWNSLCSNIHALLSKNPSSKSYCASVQAGMFGRGQASLDPLNGDVYVVTGNGPWDGKTDWGDSVLKLTGDGSHLVDSFTPHNQAYLNGSDSDLGSTGSDVLPPVTDGGKTYHLLVQGGKGPSTSSRGPAVLWLINRDRMGSEPGPGSLGGQLQHIPAPGGCEVLRKGSAWRNAKGDVFAIYANTCGLTSYRVDTSGKRPKLTTAWSLSGTYSSPVVKGNDLYVGQDGAVQMLSAATGKTLFSTTAIAAIGPIHWEYPAVSGKLMFMADENGTIWAFRRT